MRTIHVLNVNEAYSLGIKILKEIKTTQDSRTGEVVAYPDPVSTIYLYPDQRVLFDKERDANPFFHFMEGLWMLAGRNDVEWVSRFNKTIHRFSDDGEIFYGAYGHRWREWFGHDQLKEIIAQLKEDPNSRRCVLAMWDGGADLSYKETKDKPCNTTIYFRIRARGNLDMTVCCRSNDIIWGAYGANAVHMSMLQEYVASMVGVPLGTYTQISNDYHAYTDILNKLKPPQPAPHNPYDLGRCRPYPMIENSDTWDAELQGWIEGLYKDSYQNSFWLGVATPMKMAWTYHEDKNYPAALDMCGYILATDWRKACEEWLKRRMESYANKRRSRPKI